MYYLIELIEHIVTQIRKYLGFIESRNKNTILPQLLPPLPSEREYKDYMDVNGIASESVKFISVPSFIAYKIEPPKIYLSVTEDFQTAKPISMMETVKTYVYDDINFLRNFINNSKKGVVIYLNDQTFMFDDLIRNRAMYDAYIDAEIFHRGNEAKKYKVRMYDLDEIGLEGKVNVYEDNLYYDPVTFESKQRSSIPGLNKNWMNHYHSLLE